MTTDDRPEIFATGALRPAADRRAALLARIEAAAAPALAARQRPRPLSVGVLRLLARSALPAGVAAAAGVVLAVSLMRSETATAATTVASVSIDPVAAGVLADAGSSPWIAQQTAPSDDEIVEAIGLGSSQ